MATHSSILAWEIPWTEEPGGLQSMGSQRVRQDLATKQQQCLFYHCLQWGGRALYEGLKGEQSYAQGYQAQTWPRSSAGHMTEE